MHVPPIVKNQHMAVTQDENRTRTVGFHASGLALWTHEAQHDVFLVAAEIALNFHLLFADFEREGFWDDTLQHFGELVGGQRDGATVPVSVPRAIHGTFRS